MKYDSDPAKYFRTYEGNINARSVVGRGRRLRALFRSGIFFNPEIFSDFLTPPPDDESIVKCPIDTRRGVQEHRPRAGRRCSRTSAATPKGRQEAGGRAPGRERERLGSLGKQAQPQRSTSVISHQMKRFAVWFGGSMLSSTGVSSASATRASSTRRRVLGRRAQRGLLGAM